jgi:hypothetical protein
MQFAKLINSTYKMNGTNLQNFQKKITARNQNAIYRMCVLSLFSFSLQGVGKDILIDKFWLVLLTFERLDNVYGF